MEFIYDEELFITDAIGDDEIITIPDDAKGIRSYAFVDLNVNTIIFGRGKNLVIEEDSFVGLKSLEIVKCEQLTWGPLSHLLEAFTECPSDICFIVNDGKRSFINKHKGTYCLFTEEDANIDIGKIYELHEYADRVKIVGFLDKHYQNLFGNIYFPDYYNGKKLELDITSTEFCKELLKRTFRYASFIKFPILVDNSRLEHQSICKLNVKLCSHLQSIHLSRLGDRIPEGFLWESTTLKSIYIPKNYFEVGGFYECYNLENIEFEDSREIQRVYKNAFKESLMERRSFNTQSAFYIDDLAISFNRRYKDSLGTFSFKDGTRVIADYFLYRTSTDYTFFTFPNSIRFIGEYSFFDSNSKFLLDEGIDEIGEKAFAYEYWEDDRDPGKKVIWKNPDDERHFDEECFAGICEELPFN